MLESGVDPLVAATLDAFQSQLSADQAWRDLLHLDPGLGGSGKVRVSAKGDGRTRKLNLVGKRSLPAGPFFSVVSYAMKGKKVTRSTVLNGSFHSSQSCPVELGVPRGRLTDIARIKEETEALFDFDYEPGPVHLVTASGTDGDRQKLFWKKNTSQGQSYGLTAYEDGERSLETSLLCGLEKVRLVSPFRRMLKRWETSVESLQSSLFARTGVKPDELTVTLTHKEDSESLSLSWKVEHDEGEVSTIGVGLVERNKKKLLHHPGINLTPKYQGMDLNKRLVQNQIAIARQTGAEAIELEAGADVGGYAWARYGWRVRDEAKPLRDELALRLAMLCLPPEQESEVALLIDSQEPDWISKIADLRDYVEFEDQRLRLGQALLMGTEWNARLALDDEQALARVLSYCKKDGRR